MRKELSTVIHLRKLAAIAALAAAGVVSSAGLASADEMSPYGEGHHHSGDSNTTQAGLIPINALNNVDVSPNLGCALNRPADDANVQSLVGLVPIGVTLNHVLQEPNINVLSNGNVTTNVHDDSCTSNQGSSQAGNNSHDSTGAGDSTNIHADGNDAGSNNQSGNGSGGLLGTTALLGTAEGVGIGH
jgi:hypothetical protein